MKTSRSSRDEAFAALLKKHDRPVDLKDALRKSVKMNEKEAREEKGCVAGGVGV
jgi:hypothetical protein